jgi:hypothetical protein
MSYGTIKVDTITFTDNSVDKSVSLSGLIQNPTFTGNITVTGTISGDVIRGGTTVSGATVTGTTANFVSGVFTTQISGATVTGTTASFTSGVFTNISGTTATITSGIIASGTAAAPSLAILADLDTGLFSPGANELAVATNGTGKLFIDATGNVGVGPIQSPSWASASSTVLSILDSAFSNVAALRVVGPTTITEVGAGPSFTFAGSFSNHPYQLYTNSIERLRITSAGLVGIGTSSPGQLLDVAGVARFGVNATKLTTYSDSTYAGFFNGSSLASNESIYMGAGGTFFYNNGSPSVTIDSTGRVGIGNSSPATTLDVVGGYFTGGNSRTDTDTKTFGLLLPHVSSATNPVNIIGALSTTGQNLVYIGGSDSNLTGTSATTIHFYTAANATTANGTERMRITAAGLVGVGTSSPQKTFHVLNPGSTYQADLRLGGTSTYYFDLSHDPATTGKTIYNAYALSGTSHGHQFQVAGTNALLIDSSGRVGIGTTAPNRKLEVSDAGADNFIRVNTTGATKSGIEFASSGTAYSQLYFTNVSPYDLSLLQQYTTGSLILGTNSTEKARLTSSGQLLVGTSTSRAVTAGTSGNWEPRLQVTKTGIDAANIAAYSFSTYAVDLGGGLGIGPDIVLARSNSDTEGTQTAIANNMLLGRITFNGSDGTAFQSGAFIAAASDGQTWASGDCPTRLVFSTTSDSASSPTERMRITSTGQVRLAGAGITFNGDTAAANELDDYEEGTWTPTLGGTATYSFQSATYTKVGRQVTVNCYLDVSAIGTGSTSIISGLPFTVGTFAPASGAVSRLTASAVNVTSLQVQLSGTTVTTVGMTVAGNMATQNVFGTGTAIFFTAVYFV